MLVIVDFGVGNLNSIRNMLKRAGNESIVSGRPEEVAATSRLLLPGMGHFDSCMQKFNNSGLRDIVEKKVLLEKVPVLGICVGLQMFMDRSEEGNESGLGWVSGNVVRFNPDILRAGLKIPHIGWQQISWNKLPPLSMGLTDSRFYFAHSFSVEPNNRTETLLTAEYGGTFVAGVEKANLIGVQFHPEKSHRFGMQLLKNFAEKYK